MNTELELGNALRPPKRLIIHILGCALYTADKSSSFHVVFHQVGQIG